MASIKNIKRRIASVGNTQKIMKAMDLVAASKLQKAKSRLGDIRPLFDNMKTVMSGIKSSIAGLELGYDEEAPPFTEEREVKCIAYIVLTSDRGLCGGFNVNVSKEALALIDANDGVEEKIIAVGSKGWEYFRRRQKNVVKRFVSASELTVFEDAEEIGRMVSEMYTSGEVDEVYLVYTHFETVMSHTPCFEKLLPIRADSGGSGTDDSGNADSTESISSTGSETDSISKTASAGVNAGGSSGDNADGADDESGNDFMTYEPDVKTFITLAVPMYLNTSIYAAMIESTVCENASRMTSMDAAARNANEIIDDLTLEYNRKRQGIITQEITEIVSGANALT